MRWCSQPMHSNSVLNLSFAVGEAIHIALRQAEPATYT
jgi:hypothetical protein